MIFGAKKGQGKQRKPHIAKDDLVSTSYFNGLYGLAEGEIAGLADGGKSIYLDGTPLINANGQPNFNGVSWDFRNGTLDQEHIKGFSAVENERSVGVELRHDRPFVQAINNTDLSAVRVRINFNALREQKTNGDITGYAISYAIDVQTDGGVFTQVLNNTVRGKASQGFKKSHRIDLPKASKNWTIRVRRITPNRDSDLIADTVSIDAITEIIDAKLRYPATAMLGLTYDASTFSNIAKLAVRLKGKLIQVPTNYDPTARTYSGLWDGTFKLAYSNNPAWVLYDICTHKRYGLGERLSGMVDKWRLYQIGQYCDELVDDGKGGKEPRFAINVYIQKDDDAYKVIQNIASVFRGLSYWDGTQIVVDSDTPKDSVYTFSPANIVGGEFSYTGTRARDRHTVVKVAWDNPDNGYKTEYELVRDERAIAKYGIRMLDIAVFGCTSQSQAQRAGQWALKSEQLETRTVSFKTGLQGFIPQVGQVINVADNVFAGRAISGRVVSHNAQSITLDRMAGKLGDSISIGTQTAKITRVDGQVITTDKALDITEDAVWAIVSDDLHLMQFRILTIAQNDDATFSITALQYEPQKYDAIDSGAVITPKPITALTATPITAPSSVTISQSVRTHQNQSVTTMTINWTQVQGAVAYRVRWRKDDGSWQTIAKISGQSVDIDGVYSGNYIAEVQAIDAFDNESLATSSQITAITGKVGKPPRLARLIATGKLFGMELTWSFNAGSDDTNYTEIQVSPDSRSNIATLGTFAYPTDKHTINGLQGNLTQFYRARIVDKLGNVSDWTAWTSGTTEAQAGKVLELLTGQITASQLHQDLTAPIGKIGGIENSLNTAKIDLSALNASMTTAKADIAKAKSDLNTAISNITTERNRISAAIADISTLQSANNAKTQEIANLTQTVNGHTGSIRDLAVTTGDLSQRYTQLKTASDNANSEITAIKQTQSGQATQLNTLGSRFDSLSVGGRNLLLGTAESKSLAGENRINQSNVMFYAFSKQPLSLFAKTNFVLSFDWEVLGDAVQGRFTPEFNQYPWSAGSRNVSVNDANRQGYYTHKILNADLLTTTATHLKFRLDGFVGTLVVRNVKLEIGNVATDWSPAPEDIDAQFVQTNANINTLQQTVTNADTALSQRIDTIDASYKSADSTINASLTAEQKARADADTALTSRIDSLSSAYKSADSALSARVATAEQSITTANQAIAQTQQTLTAKIDSLSVGGRNLLLNTANFDKNWQPTSGSQVTNGVIQVIGRGALTAVTQHSDNLNNLQAGKLQVSFLAKSNQNARLLVRSRRTRQDGSFADIGSYVTINSRDYARYVVELNYAPIDNQASANFEFVTYEPSGVVFEIKLPKLEIGTIATDWTPAPEDVDAQFVQTNANISTLEQTVTNADQALSQRIDTLDANYKSADRALNSSITTEQTARADADNALSQRISQLDSAYKSADSALSARVATAQQTATNAQNAVATAQSQLNARLDNLKIGGRNLILGSQVSRTAHGTTALNVSQNIDFGNVTHLVLSCDVRFANAQRATTQGAKWFRIGAEIRCVWTDGTSNWYGAWQSNVANGTSFDGRVEYKIATPTGKTLRAIDDAKIQIWDITADNMLVKNPKLELGTIATDWTPAPEDVNVDLSPYATNANLDEFKRTEAKANDALSQRIDSLNTSLGTKANAAALNDLSTKVNQVDGKINAEASKISTLQTTVNGQTASIQQHSQSINGLSAQWTLKAESNGIVSGIGLASSNGVSDFAVRANKFYVTSPTGTTKTPLFSVLTTATTINGVSVPAGVYLSSAYIQNGTITNVKIANGAITTAKIGNAQIGNAHIANGAITTAKIGTAQVDTLQIAGEAVIVPRVQFTESQFDFYAVDTEVEINRVTIDAKGGAVAVGFGFERLYARAGGNNNGFYGRVIMRIKRGNTVLRTLNFVKNGEVFWYNGGAFGNHVSYYQASITAEWIVLPTLMDVPPSGNQTYTVTLESRGLNSGISSSDTAIYPVSITARSLHVMGVKR